MPASASGLDDESPARGPSPFAQAAATPVRGRVRMAAIVLAAAVVAALFAWNVRHWWFLNDDAYITFRYARHLVEGHGPVWNPGERVEGYTEFLWMLLLAGGIALGAPPEVFSNVLLVIAGAGILVAVACAGARRFGWASPFTWLAPLLLALHRVFTAWSTSGMAMQLFALLVLLGYLRLLRERDEAGSPRGGPAGAAGSGLSRNGSWLRLALVHNGSSLMLALATLTRPEGVLATGLAGAFFLLDVVRRRRTARALIAWCLPWLLIVGAHFLWRRSYYGYWLPNTFHAKVSGLYLEQAVRWFALFFRDFQLHWFLPLLLLLAWGPRRFEHALFGTWIVAHLGYVASVGGDVLEFRFWCPVLPFLFLMMSDALRRLASVGIKENGAATAAALGLVMMTHFGSHREEARPIRDWVMSVEKMADYARRRANEGRFLRALVDRGALPADLRIAVGGAGAVPWYSRLYTVDYLGLNDVEIARQPIVNRGMIGHERHASLDLLARRHVDLIDSANQLTWRGPPEDLPRTAGFPYLKQPLRCLDAGPRYLLFSSSLDASKFRERFGKLPVVF